MSKPTGRAAVMAAVQDAAVELLAEHGPRGVTVRAVAARAGVNHALIHRHFGTKDALVRAVVTEQSRRLAAAAAELPGNDPAAMLRLLQEHGGYWRVLARVVLDEPALLTGQSMPAAATTLARLAGDGQAGTETRTAAAVAAATALGWLVFGPHLAQVLGIDDERALEQAVQTALRDAVRPGVSSRRGGRAGPGG